MSDKRLRELERAYTADPSDSNARLLARELDRIGNAKEAQALRQRISYVDMVSGLPLPTEAQTRAFAEYSAGAHSWYKHLRYRSPTRFYPFLNPAVMMYEDGSEVTDEDRPIHYSSMTAKKYRELYGYWSYGIAHGEPDKPFLAAGVDPKQFVPLDLCFYANWGPEIYKAKFRWARYDETDEKGLIQLIAFKEAADQFIEGLRSKIDAIL